MWYDPIGKHRPGGQSSTKVNPSRRTQLFINNWAAWKKGRTRQRKELTGKHACTCVSVGNSDQNRKAKPAPLEVLRVTRRSSFSCGEFSALGYFLERWISSQEHSLPFSGHRSGSFFLFRLTLFLWLFGKSVKCQMASAPGHMCRHKNRTHWTLVLEPAF